jgi:hypothetical protein
MSESNPKNDLARELAASGVPLSELAKRLARIEAVTKERSDSVDKITWAQVGLVSEAGRYMFKFGWLTITADDLAIWKQYPNTEFALVRMAGTEAGEEFRLGTFDLRTYLSPSER